MLGRTAADPNLAAIQALLGGPQKSRYSFAQPQVSFTTPRQPISQGSLAPQKRSISQYLEDKAGDVLRSAGVAPHNAQRIAGKAFGAFNDLTPVGNVTGAQEGYGLLKQGVTKGDVATGALGLGSLLLSILPGVNGAKKPLKSLLHDTTGAIRAYHGGTAHHGNFNLDHAGTGLGYADEPAVWFTPDKFEANRYAWSVGGGPLNKNRPASGSYYGKAVYPATIDDAGFDDIAPMNYDPEEFARIIAEARNANKPGIIFRSVREDDRLSSPADQIAVLDPSRIGSYFAR